LKSDDGDVQGIVGVGLDLAEGLWENKEQQKLVHKMTQAQDAAILVLARLIEMRGGHRGGHLDRMQEYCRVLCVSLAKLGTFGDVVDNRFTEDLVRAAIFHDVGETLLPDTVLLFEGEYGPKEREIMRQHAEIGGRALKEAAAGLGTESYLTVAAEVALYHHERWDGTGYPSGLKGRDIPLSARIVAVADSYDALTSEKTYRKAYSHEEACTIIKDEKGTHFDPNVIAAFEDLEGAFRMTRMAFEE
jgi:response regulator RpfG family c-di-GMP phosphodiesterase